MSTACAHRIHGGPDRHGAVRWDFSTNVNSAGPCPIAVHALGRADPTRYPDPRYDTLRRRIGAWHEVSPDRVLFCASASEFIQRITAVSARLAPGPIAIPRFAYGDYAAAAKACGRPIVVLDADDRGAALRWCAEPGSPRGEDAPPPADVADCPTVLDAAYAPLRLRGRSTWGRDSLDTVFQLFSPNKALGLPGVRGAYAIAPQAAHWPVEIWRDALEASQPSWPLGAHAVALLEAWTRDETQDWLAEARGTLERWTADLRAALLALGLHPMHSVTPFLCALRPSAADARSLRRCGVAVRDAASFGLQGWMRVSAQPPEALASLVAALSIAMNSNVASGEGRACRPARHC